MHCRSIGWRKTLNPSLFVHLAEVDKIGGTSSPKANFDGAKVRQDDIKSISTPLVLVTHD